MPWCPKCRNEYIEGITTCVECGVELVDELPEEINPEEPFSLCTVQDEETGGKFIAYLLYGGITTAGLLPNEEDGTFQVVVAYFEKEPAEELLGKLGSEGEITEADINELIPNLEKQLEELEEEEANIKLSELRTEASSVYVKKRDKYSDLKFSGISFIIFGILGFGILLLNMLGYLSFFNKFSTLIMGIVFVIFLIIGIVSLIRASSLKNIVSEEDKVTNEVLDWIDASITDELISSLMDEGLSQEDNYFAVHGRLCEMTAEQFPFFNRGYIDQLIDERYNEYCEEMEKQE